MRATAGGNSLAMAYRVAAERLSHVAAITTLLLV